MKSHHPTGPVLRLVGEADEFHNGAWQHGRLLVLSEHATLPDRCIVCNQAAEGQTLDKTLYWRTPFLLALLALNPFIYALKVSFHLFISSDLTIIDICMERETMETVA